MKTYARPMSDDWPYLKAGQDYEVIEERDGRFKIVDECGDHEWFSWADDHRCTFKRIQEAVE